MLILQIRAIRASSLFYMKSLALIVLVLSLASCGRQFRFEETETQPQDVSPVYRLPFPSGTTSRLIQGYNSKLSHKGRLALDFKMKSGSPVLAARSGIVSRVVEHYTKGGTSKKYYGKANAVVIRHSDGSQAMYAHLQHEGALVNVGDTVQAGQLIARSGSTGYSATPHLHFIVWGRGGGVPTRFMTKRGARYLKPGVRYKAP